MIRRPPRSTPFPTRRSSDLSYRLREIPGQVVRFLEEGADVRRVIGTARGAAGTLRVSPSDGHADRKSTRLKSSHANISYAVFCLKKKKRTHKNRSTH